MPSTTHPHQDLSSLRPGDPLRIDAGAIADGHRVRLAPASMLLRTNRACSGSPPSLNATILAVDSPGAIDTHPEAARATRLDLRGSILFPGLVNAHAHLDLTRIGPLNHDPGDGFVAWIERVRDRRATTDAEIEASVREGIILSLAGGTVAIGDIAGAPAGRPSLIPYQTLRDSPLAGISYLEFFAIGAGEARGLKAAEAALARGLKLPGSPDGTRLGLQPHAPYSVSPRGYLWAIERAKAHGLPLATHLAETAEEREFIARASGPQRRFLEQLGLWDDRLLEWAGRGLHAIAHMDAMLAMHPMLCAHVNHATHEGIASLGRSNTAVVYCPRASAYFGTDRHFGPHRYREMLSAGVTVCLGTDSIVNLPASARDPASGGISVLDEMRLLHERDGTDPAMLLAMATTAGASALSLDPSRFRFEPGSRPAGIAHVPAPGRMEDPLRSLVRSDGPARLLFHGNPCGLTGTPASRSQE